MRRLALIMMLGAAPVAAEDWLELDGAQTRRALEGREVIYADARQEFRASGRTLYVFGGRDSWGYWRVQGDQYCSQWPPSDLWACYNVELLGNRVRFIGAEDDVTEGVYGD